MKQIMDRLPFTPERFLRDLRFTADLVGSDFHEAAAQRVLEVFDEEFRTHVVQLKAASKPGSGLYYRVFYNGPQDLTGRAQAEGMLPAERTPAITLQEEILAACPGATRAGLDFDTTAPFARVAKVWTFTGGPAPVGRLLDIRAIPDSVRAHESFFARFGLRDVYFVASDYQQGTMNVYFGWEPEHRSAAWIQRMQAETGGVATSGVPHDEILRSMAVSAGVGMTFSWQRPELLRWCVYGLNVSTAAQASPIRLPQRLELLRTQAPTLNDHPQINVAWSFGRVGYYLKLEKSYARDANFLHTAVMGGDFSHPAQAAVPA
jgi:hypothetical protein